MRRRGSVLPIWLLLLLVAPVASTSEGREDGPEASQDADDGSGEGREKDYDEDEREEDEWEEEERDVDVEMESDKFHVASRRDSVRGNDELRTEFHLEDGALDFRFESRGETGSSVRLKVTDWTLLEYADEDANARLGNGETIVQRLRPEDAASPILRRTTEPGGVRVNATYGLAAGGSWGLSFLIPSQPQDADGIQVDPTEIKFDIAIDRFPYRQAESALAVRFRFESEAEMDEGDKDAVPGLFAGQGAIRGFLRWVNHSMVDGRTETVGVHVAESKFESGEGELAQNAIVTFSYARGSHILHDPSIGVALSLAATIVDLTAPWGHWGLVGIGFAGAGALVAVTFLPRVRPRH